MVGYASHVPFRAWTSAVERGRFRLHRGRPSLVLNAAGEPDTHSLSAWSGYLVGVATLTTAYMVGHFLGPHWLNSGPVYNLIGGSAVVALIVGARKNSPGRRLPWYLLAAAQTFFVTGDVLSYNYERFFGRALPFPSIADASYLCVGPLMVAGLVVLMRGRDETRSRASLIDSLIITVAAAALSWVYLMAPYAHDHTLTLATKLTSIAYPVMDILILSVVLRMAVGTRRRDAATGMLLAGAAMLLLTDSIYGWKLLHGGYTTGGVLDVGWAAFYALLGAAALHPSARQPVEHAPDSGVRLSKPRLALLTCATLTAPTLLIVRGPTGGSFDSYLLVAASIILFILVLLRMTGLVHWHEEAVRREAGLRLAGEALVAAASREEIYAAAMQATRSVVNEEVIVRLYLADGTDGSLTAVGSSDGASADLPQLVLAELHATVREGLGEHRVVNVMQSEQTLSLAPLFLREQLTGVLAVTSATQLKRAAMESLATLASEVALALQSATLTEDALLRRSEARLSSLVKNASDVICIVGEDAVIRYMSPSVEQMFGYLPSGLVGTRLVELVYPADRARVLAATAAIAAEPVGSAQKAEFRVRRANDGWLDVEALGTNLLGDEAVNGIVLNIRDVTQRKAFEAELKHQAFHDALTGLPNRALFHNRLEHALAGQHRDGSSVAVLFLDVDALKDINDSLGHAAGDKVLQQVGRRLSDCMRRADTAARIGGDEFAVAILGSESDMHSIEIAQRVTEALAHTLTIDGKQLTVATSMGIAFSQRAGVPSRDADELLRDADAAMYVAKQAGTGGYAVFHPDMHAEALARLELKADLQRAMDAGEFTLRYQPIMDLSRHDMAGMEALARWEHPTRGVISPEDFIPVAEETGLIVPLGRHILCKACRHAVWLQQECPRDPPLSIAVNVSAFQLQRPEFIDEVRDVLGETGIAPSSLILELTESVMLQDMDRSVLRMNDLRALGVTLAIDDFGTGYSSLGYLRRLPVDILKIDRSFLADPSPSAALLIVAVVQLAGIFKLQTVVEGVEDETYLERLKDTRCDFGQGFYFAKPLSGAEVMAFAAQHSQVAIGIRALSGPVLA
jgi:diguanylate cyclase (GGDEF)-like protein/PAS domain S-box-containing protein